MVVWADFDVGRLGIDFDGDGVAFEVGLDGQVAEELDGEDPRFELAILGAHEDSAGAGYGERLRGLRGAADGES